MRDLLLAELPEEIIVKAPADVVVAAQIIQENIFLRQCEHGIHLMAEQPDVAGRYRIPHRAHRRHIVEHVALGLFHGSEIRNHLRRLHDDLAEEKRAGADDLAGHTHDADQRMHLRQVPALRSELLPDIRHCIQTDNIDTVIAEIQHIGRHVVENSRIAVVKIPLIGIECGHDDLPHLRAPGEIPGRGGRENLRHRLFKLIRNRPIVEEEEHILVFLFSPLRANRPLMILAGMVHDKIKTHTHAVPMALARQLREIRHRPELRLHGAKIRHRIPAVAPILRALQKRHQMQIVDPALFQIIEM